MYPKMSALYGVRRDITEYPAGYVLQELSCMSDEQRLQDLANHHMIRAKV